jgi:hypothetical protein
MLSKKSQTYKAPKTKDKKLSKSEYRNFCDSIIYWSDGICQWCEKSQGKDMHHSSYGCMGANKDDKTLVLLCRECHELAHSGANREALQILGKANWLAFKGKQI